MPSASLQSLRAVRNAITVARAVYVQPRFGCSERWVQITKREARALLASYSGEVTPGEAEMSTDSFGEFDENGALWLG